MTGEGEFAAAGLLDGLEGAERQARLELLAELADAGVPLEQLERAVREDRLATLPVELVFTRGCTYTPRQMLAETGHDEGFMRRNYRSLGLPIPGFDEPAISEHDMESWRMLKALLDAGLPEESVHELGRLVGRGAAQLAEGILDVFVRSYLRPGDTERDFGLRFAELATQLSPALGPLTTGPVRLHLREQIRHAVISQAERSTGRLPGARPIAVGFADLVGYTPLAARASAAELDELTRRLEVLGAGVASTPVRLIKLIGDEVMLASPEAAALVEATRALVAAGEAGELPRLRAGVATGTALNRAGDWYGTPVNLAHRITEIAPPGAVLASADVAAQTAERFPWRALGPRRLRGFDREVELHALAA
jgi:adenylate cyclase